MAIVRILVDGYSLLHHWAELCGSHAPYSATARQTLVQRLTVYRDTVNIPITIVFDGAGRTPDVEIPSSPEMEVLYSQCGQTADQLIERLTVLMKPHGEVLVVTDDVAERELVLSMGGAAASCLNFITDVENTLNDLGREIHNYNLRERTRYKQSR